VAFTWRDPIIAGPLRAEQVLLLLVAIVAAIGLFERRRAPLQAPIEPERALVLDVEE